MHTRGQSISFLENCFGSSKLSNAGLNASFSCPICNDDKKKLVIHTETFLVHCWKCGYKSKTIYYLLKKYHPEFLTQFLNEFKGDELLSDKELDQNDGELSSAISLPHGFIFLAEYADYEDADLAIRKSINYLYSRGLTKEDLWYFKFGISTKDIMYKNRVIIPSFNKDGELNFFTSRVIDNRIKPKYFNPIFHRDLVVFNEINIDWSKELTIVEGPFDLVKTNNNSTCLLGKELDDSYLLFNKIIENQTPIVLAIDNDAKKEAIKIAKKLIEFDISVRIYQFPDKIKDPGEMSKEQFEQGIENSIPFDFEHELSWKISLLDSR